MRITKDNSNLTVALKVLKHINIPDKDVTIRTYSNCREQGLHIAYYGGKPALGRKAVSFAENRNSDDIVVLYGLASDFAMDGTPYDEDSDIWKDRKYFKCNEHEKAGKFVYNWLKGRIKEEA